MVQVQQVAAAQEEAVVLAQALLDRERVAAEEREKAQLQAQLAAAQQQARQPKLPFLRKPYPLVLPFPATLPSGGS